MLKHFVVWVSTALWLWGARGLNKRSSSVLTWPDKVPDDDGMRETMAAMLIEILARDDEGKKADMSDELACETHAILKSRFWVLMRREERAQLAARESKPKGYCVFGAKPASVNGWYEFEPAADLYRQKGGGARLQVVGNSWSLLDQADNVLFVSTTSSTSGDRHDYNDEHGLPPSRRSDWAVGSGERVPFILAAQDSSSSERATERAAMRTRGESKPPGWSDLLNTSSLHVVYSLARAQKTREGSSSAAAVEAEPTEDDVLSVASGGAEELEENDRFKDMEDSERHYNTHVDELLEEFYVGGDTAGDILEMLLSGELPPEA